MKYAYVIEDGEIVEFVAIPTNRLDDIPEFVNDLCEYHFDEEFNETDEETKGTLYSVSEVEMVFVTELETTNVSDLW